MPKTENDQIRTTKDTYYKTETEEATNPESIKKIAILFIFFLSLIFLVLYCYLGYWLYFGITSDWESVAYISTELEENLPMFFVKPGILKVINKNSIDSVRSILENRGQSSVSLLLELYRNAEKDEEKYDILDILRVIGPKAKEALPFLKKQFSKDSSKIRHYILSVISEIASKDEMKNIVTPLLREDNVEIRLKAAYLLAKKGINEDKMIDFMVKEAKNNNDFPEIIGFIYFKKLGKKAKAAIPTIIESLSYMGLSRDRALEALRNIDLEEAIYQLEKIIKNKKKKKMSDKSEIEKKRHLNSIQNLERALKTLQKN